MTEKELQNNVIDVAHLFNWAVAHFRSVESKRQGWITPVAGDGKGFPDLCLVRERIVWIELKVGRNTLSPEQEFWRDRILAAGGEWYLLTEKDWMDGTIEKVLR